MEKRERSSKADCTEPYCFPNLLKPQPGEEKTEATRSFVFLRQFSTGQDRETHVVHSPEVCPPPWDTGRLSMKEDRIDQPNEASEAYREIIDRMVEENQQQLKEVYAKGVAEGRQKGLQEGRKQGKQEGLLEGRAEGEARIAPIAKAFQQAIHEMHALRRDLLHEATTAGVKLAFHIAETILGNQLRLHPDGMMRILERACSMATPSSIVRVRLHPDAVEFCQNNRSHLPFQEDVLLVADATIGFGGCVLETDSGEIDARIESQLQVLAEAVERELAFSDGLQESEFDQGTINRS